MNNFLALRTFCAVFLVLFGIGLIFVRTEQGQIFIGSFTAAVGITFLARLGLALRDQWNRNKSAGS